MLAGLERLVEHSLVVSYRGTAGPRMRMLETIREYARMKLKESGEADDVGARHDEYFDDFVRELRPLFDGPRASEAMARLDEDWDNIAATVPWRLAADDFETLAVLAESTWRYIWLYDRLRETMSWMEPVYEARGELEPALRGELCRIWGSSLHQFGEYIRAKGILEEAVELLTETGPPDREAWARAILGGSLPSFDALDSSLEEITRAVEIFRAEADDFGLGTALGMRGMLLTVMGRIEEGRELLDESLAAAQRVGLPALIGANRALRAVASLAAGDVLEARRYLQEATSTPLYLEGTADLSRSARGCRPRRGRSRAGGYGVRRRRSAARAHGHQDVADRRDGARAGGSRCGRRRPRGAGGPLRRAPDEPSRRLRSAEAARARSCRLGGNLTALPVGAIEREAPPAPGDEREEQGCDDDRLRVSEDERGDQVDDPSEGEGDRGGAGDRLPVALAQQVVLVALAEAQAVVRRRREKQDERDRPSRSASRSTRSARCRPGRRTDR